MLEPLKQFYCDSCGQIIEQPEDGWLEWLCIDSENGKVQNSNFRIVHHKSNSSYLNGGCYNHTNKDDLSDGHLHHFIEEGMPFLLQLLQEDGSEIPTVKSISEYVELVRRLTIPYYEEARLYWQKATKDNLFDDFDGASRYHTDVLQMIIKRYG